MSMSELKLQKWIMDRVKENGGQAIKMSNKFIAGVPDLLIKMPGYPAIISEVKVGKYLKSVDTWYWEPTKLQLDFLRDWRSAGMVTCIMVGFGADLTDFKLIWVNNIEYVRIPGELINKSPSKKEYAKTKLNMVQSLIHRGIENASTPFVT